MVTTLKWISTLIFLENLKYTPQSSQGGKKPAYNIFKCVTFPGLSKALFKK